MELLSRYFIGQFEISNIHNNSMFKRLIYIADPMCSWCYGFSPIIQKIREEYKERLDFELILGGLRPGGGDPWNQQFKDFLRHHWEEVHARSKQPFSFDLFDLEEFNYDTEPACRAVRVIRDLSPEHELSFFSKVQRGFYLENKVPQVLNFYEPIVRNVGVDWEAFVGKYQDDIYISKTREDFQKAARMGIRGFPSLVIEQDNRLQLVSHGYMNLDQVRDRIEGLIA